MSRRMTSLNNPEGATPGDCDHFHAQPVRPDDYDDSRDFDRVRSMNERPPLDEDPLIRM
jgi:hypothetical protein